MGEPALENVGEGTLLAGKYLLETRLGAGGMGEVFRAQNTLIGRAVAIKVLRPEHAQNPDIVTRFLREARAANLVRHHNVVDVLDIGQDERGTPFIVQELLEGEDLARRVTDLGGRLPLEVALRILLPVIDAVAFGHARGVVHRDLKPENVFLARVEGKLVPKLLDFGISQITGGPNEQRVTAMGVAMGTPAYMSPEQIQGHRVDARADVWALGIILHEIVSGDLPFPADSQGGLFVQICTASPVPLLQAAPHAPPELEEIILRCLKKTREERYADAAELARELRQLWELLSASKSEPLREAERLPPPRAEAVDSLATASTAIHASPHIPAQRAPAASVPEVPDFEVPDLAIPDKPRVAAPPASARALPAAVAAAAPRATPTTSAIGGSVQTFGFDDDEVSGAASGIRLEGDSMRPPSAARRGHRGWKPRVDSLAPTREGIGFRAVLHGFALLLAIALGVTATRYVYETFGVYAAVTEATAGLKPDSGLVVTGGVILAVLGFVAVPKTYRSLRDAPALGVALSLLIAVLWFSGVELVVHTFD